MSDFSVINSRAPRTDAPDKATGKAKYIDDLSFPGALYGALFQSPHAHARILNIDTSKAVRLPGVKAVVTAFDAPKVKYGVSPARYDETLFCEDRVRYVGDEIAAVAARASPGPALNSLSVQVTAVLGRAGDGSHPKLDGDRSGTPTRTTAERWKRRP